MIVSKCLFSTSVFWAFTIGLRDSIWSWTTRHESVCSELSDSSRIRTIGELVRNGDAYTSPTDPNSAKVNAILRRLLHSKFVLGKARYSKDLFNTSSNNEQFHCSWNRPFSGLIVVKSLLSWAFPQTCEARVYILCSLFRYEHEAADIKSLMSFSQKEERMDIRASYETQLAMRGHYIGEVSVGWKVRWASLAHGWRALAVQDGCCIPGASLHSTE